MYLRSSCPASRECLFLPHYTLIAHPSSNRQSSFSPLTNYLPLPKYFESEWSYAQYRIPAQSSHISLSSTSVRSPTADVPDEERCVVGWIEGRGGDPDQPSAEYQLVALTYTGGWYRLSLPSLGHSELNAPTATSGSPPKPSPMTRQRTPSVSSVGRSEKGKEKEKDKEGKEKRDCILREFRRYGRWDGWG